MTRLLATTALVMFVVQGAVAADTKSNQATTGASQNTATLPQQVKQDLQDYGFTNVKVVPGSLVISADDKRGNPVTMVIGPHSMTMVKAIGNDQTTGSGSSDDANGAGSSGNK